MEPKKDKPKSLVLIVGAGASKEALLPIGAELMNQIASVLDIRFEHGIRQISGDDDITQALRFLASQQFLVSQQEELKSYLKACWMIRDAMSQAASIDNFIDAHRENGKIAECGKLAIARCILEAEAASIMRVDRSNIYNKINFEELKPTWYTLFFRLLVENCGLEDIPERLSRIAIITFNYDRCIENYLYEAIRNYYDTEVEETKAILANLHVYHPYGYLGPLPWTASQKAIEFGVTPNSHQLLEIARELKTFTEGTDESNSDIIEIRSTLQTADRVAFLGFAFSRQNLELLYGPIRKNVELRTTPVFATALGLSESNVEIILDELRTMAGYQSPVVRIKRNLTCAQLIEEYSRSLAIH